MKFLCLMLLDLGNRSKGIYLYNKLNLEDLFALIESLKKNLLVIGDSERIYSSENYSPLCELFQDSKHIHTLL